MGASHTYMIRCPKCGSDDCNYTRESLGEAIRASFNTLRTYCNKCTFTSVVLLINNKEIFRETKEAGSEDTELVYSFLGTEKSR